MSSVPIAELEELVEEWREGADRRTKDEWISGKALQLNDCATILEELIEEHKND